MGARDDWRGQSADQSVNQLLQLPAAASPPAVGQRRYHQEGFRDVRARCDPPITTPPTVSFRHGLEGISQPSRCPSKGMGFRIRVGHEGTVSDPA